MTPTLGDAGDEDNEAHQHSQVKLLPLLLASLMKKKKVSAPFWRKLNKEGRRRRQRNLMRESLLSLKHSPWTPPHTSANDGAVIAVTGFDVATFQCLLGLFAPCFLAHTPWVGEQNGFNCRKLNKSTETKGRKRLAS